MLALQFVWPRSFRVALTLLVTNFVSRVDWLSTGNLDVFDGWQLAVYGAFGRILQFQLCAVLLTSPAR